MTPLAPYYWLCTPGHRTPIRKPQHLDAYRRILEHLNAAGKTAWIERFDGKLIYPRPKRRPANIQG